MDMALTWPRLQGVPTVKLYIPSGKKGRPRVMTYPGERKAKAIVNFVTQHMPNHVVVLKDSDGSHDRKFQLLWRCVDSALPTFALCSFFFFISFGRPFPKLRSASCCYCSSSSPVPLCDTPASASQYFPDIVDVTLLATLFDPGDGITR